MATCSQCGRDVPEGVALCEECAASREEDTTPTAPQFHPAYVPPLSMPELTPEEPPASPFHAPLTEKQLSPEYKPLGAWTYFLYMVLFAIPLVGFIFLLVFSLGGTRNVNLRNFARSYFCGLLVAVVLTLLTVALLLALRVNVVDLLNFLPQ